MKISKLTHNYLLKSLWIMWSFSHHYFSETLQQHYSDVIMGAMASQITSLTIGYRLFGRRSKKTSKFPVTGLCAGNSPVTGEFPAQMASNAEKISISWRHRKGVCFHVDILSMIYQDICLLLHRHLINKFRSVVLESGIKDRECNYITQILSGVITCPCSWYLLLA